MIENMSKEKEADLMNDMSGEEVKIKDIFTITRGKVIPKSNLNDAGKYPVYSSQTSNGGVMGYTDDYLFENAITWTTDGANAGTVSYREGKFNCSNVCGVLLSDKGYVNRYMAEYINSITKQYVSYVGNPKLMNNVVSEIPIKLISLKLQVRYSNLLTSIDELLENNKNKLTELKLKKQYYLSAIFNDMSGEKIDLGDVAVFSKGNGISKEEISMNGKYKCIRYGELFTEYNAGIFNIKSYTNCQYDILSKGNETLMPTSDVTPFGLATASAIFEKNVIIGSDILIISSGKYLNSYLAYAIRACKNAILRLVTGTTIFHIYEKDMKNFKIPLISLEEQNKIANFLTSIDELIENQEKTITQLEVKKKYYLNKIFS